LGQLKRRGRKEGEKRLTPYSKQITILDDCGPGLTRTPGGSK